MPDHKIAPFKAVNVVAAPWLALSDACRARPRQMLPASTLKGNFAMAARLLAQHCRWLRMSWPRILLIAIAVSLASAARAGVTSSDLAIVGVTPLANAQIPTDAIWQNEKGVNIRLADALHRRPGVVMFADFNCSSLCGSMLSVAAELLARSGLQPERGFALIVLGLDAQQPAAAADAFKQHIANSAVLPAVSLLSADAVRVHEATQAVGYRFVYDAERHQYAHPAALLIVTPDGRVSRVLSGLGLSVDDLRLALLEAGEGQVGTLADRVRLMCYGFDPALGIYTPLVHRSLLIGSGVMLVLLVGYLLGLSWRGSS